MSPDVHVRADKINYELYINLKNHSSPLHHGQRLWVNPTGSMLKDDKSPSCASPNGASANEPGRLRSGG